MVSFTRWQKEHRYPLTRQGRGPVVSLDSENKRRIFRSSHNQTISRTSTFLIPRIFLYSIYRGADNSLARPTSRCILFDGENISFDASLVKYIYIYIYIYSTNIPPIMTINRIYEHQKSSVAVACFLPGQAKDLSATLY